MAELRGPECASDAFKVPASDFRTWRANKVAFLRIFERRPEVVAARRAEARRAARSPASGSYCYRPEQNTMFELRGTACAADAFKVTASAFRTWSSGRDAFLLSWDRARGARDAGAQFRLAKRYERGDGVPQDMADALRFYRMASNQGSERALAALQRIMNESRLAEERSRAEEERKAAEAERRRVTEEQKRAVEEAERQRIAGLTRGLASADVVTAIVNDGVNLRALPESTASVVRQLPKGRQVQVTGVLPSGWLRIAEEGTAVGWIFKTAVAPGTLAASPPAAARPAVLAAAADEVELDPLDAPYRITSAANVRAAPDVSAQRVAGLREGDRVTALGKVRGKDWYLVERDGERLGFVFGPLLTPVATSPQTQVAAVAAETRRAEPPQPVLAPERRIALVIGNGRYSGQAPPLANPPNDARLMTSVLRARGFEVIELIDADRRTMKRAISDFGRRLEAAGENSVGLFYYAGHGVQLDGRNFLIPIGAEISREPDVDIEAVNAAAVLAQMAFARNRLNFMILDSCRNNPYARSFRAVTRGLARMDASRGTLVAYATGPGQVALDGSGLNSPYTLALAEAMAVPGIPVEQMFKRVRESVIEQTNDEQVPWESSLITGDFFFNPVATPNVLVNAPGAGRAPSESAEITFWNTIKDGGNRAAFEAYLAQFPTGVFATLARIRLDELAPE